jgi:hypothetical protein
MNESRIDYKTKQSKAKKNCTKKKEKRMNVTDNNKTNKQTNKRERIDNILRTHFISP